jgi:hypothetical protein
MEMEGLRDKLFGALTNTDWDGDEVIRFSHRRSAMSEEAQAVLKRDVAGSHMPSQQFGMNAVRW